MSKDAASDIISQLSTRLAQLREDRGISKKRLSAMSKMDRSTVSFIEAPDENPTLYNLLRYALALKIDVGLLLSEYLAPHLVGTKPKSEKNSKRQHNG